MPSVQNHVARGVLELHAKGHGFLRDAKMQYRARSADPYVPSQMVGRYRLREGLLVEGAVGTGRHGLGPRLSSVDRIEGKTPDQYLAVKPFDELTAIDPHERLVLETGPEPMGPRVMDLLTPIGRGQRALIVAPPRTGKTILLQQIAAAVAQNYPAMQIVMLLVDERPEEVTDMRRKVRGEVMASSSDREIESHIRMAELVMERAKRIAETGGEVFVLLDSLTRLARAYNKWVGSSGRTMSGGIDVRALETPRRLFATARVFDEGGSVTVVATCLIDTGSRMDDIIFQEFKGTGNMELVLDRKLSDRRVWPAMDITQSGTRKEELLLPKETLKRVTLLRRGLIKMHPVQAMEELVKTLGKYPSNKEFLEHVGQFERD